VAVLTSLTVLGKRIDVLRTERDFRRRTARGSVTVRGPLPLAEARCIVFAETMNKGLILHPGLTLS